MLSDRIALEEQSNKLRIELKAWEKQFALANDGRKAGRDDIKADHAIATKYKTYNKIRDALSGKVGAVASPKKQRKRKSDDEIAQTPSKKMKAATITPRKIREPGTQPNDPSPQQQTPSMRHTIVGPTPQKNGKLLGIFDIMSLPSRTPSSKERAALADLHPNIVETPSKKRTHGDVEGRDDIEPSRHCKTPQSSAKRIMLDMFMTPQRPKSGPHGTPSSSMKAFATPSFLRRRTLPMETVNEIPSPDQPQPWKRKSFGRSLSSMIADLRKQEDHEHDEELAILREMEGGVPDDPVKPAAPATLVKDSQVEVVLDVDGFVPSDFEDEGEQVGENDPSVPPKRVWKKKGLKRQTRRVIMRPVKKVAPTEQFTQEPGNSDDEHDASEGNQAPDEQSCDDVDSDFASKPKSMRPRGTKQRCEKLVSSVAAKVQQSNRKTKANSLAHANFVKLKIKNKNSKAKGRGRFGRRK